MPDFRRPAERCRGKGRLITMFSADAARDTGTRKLTTHRPGGDRSHAIGDRFQPQDLPEILDPVSLHANAELLEARRLTDANDVARDALRRNEPCKNFGAGLILIRRDRERQQLDG